MITYRVYATNDFFYDPDDSQKIKPLIPFTINNFPDKEWELTCFFGEVPEKIKHVHYSIKGFGLLCIQSLVNAVDSTKTGQEQLEECILKAKSEFKDLTKYKWYTTVVVEKDINIQNFKTDDLALFSGKETLFEKNFVYPTARAKLFGGELLVLLNKEKEKLNFPDLFNKVTICLMTEIPNSFFSKVIDEGYALIINGTYVIGKTNFTFSADLNVNKKYKTLNQDKIISLIKHKGTSQNDWLKSVSHWYMAMMHEEDKWKKFYFGFICLEILTHKIFKKILQDKQLDVHLKTSEGYDKLVNIPISDVFPEETNRITIATKFSFVAGILNPEKYSGDKAIFKKCKDVRDKISHGEIITIEELPVVELQTILDSYIQKMITNY